ncbi:hypothetical protein J2741_000310 [Methanolinea mesophila]|uniref:hypothetical protein n=1 Tax=Methanolinea mesophila TaxID=547055 RepID=UPI001AEAA7F9|nr:hypothetical protein [Methanolinea mesophila]MBP1927763.1 hypothetical protein [Methanolinea mesophila]
MKKDHFMILAITIFLTVFLLIIPASAKQYETTSADGKYSNPYPNKIYGDEFRSPERPYAAGFGVGEVYGDASVGTDSEFKWTFVICFTPEEDAQFKDWMFNRWDTPLIDVLDMLVPEQVAALPDDLVRYLRDHPYITVGHDPASEIGSWSYNVGEDTWTDFCGTHVPSLLVPRTLVPGDDRGVVLWGCLGSTYTPEVQEHLDNLGLATHHQSLNPTFSTSVKGGTYIVVFEGNTHQGERKSWTLIHKPDGSWTDAATGEEICYDMHYVLAAFCFATSPDYTPPPMAELLAAQIPKGLQTDSLMAAVRSKAGSVSSIPSVSSHTSSTLANTLLSQVSTSKISRTATTSTASTASLVSQATDSLSDESTAGGNFDMASFAASYRSGGTAIASKGFGSDVLAARGIGG